MLMHGEKFSIIPLTTHINLKNINRSINFKFINNSLKSILLNINKPFFFLVNNSDNSSESISAKSLISTLFIIVISKNPER